MASIRNRGPRQWEVRIRRKGYPVQFKTFTRKLDAETWARDVEAEMDKGVFVSRKEAEETTLNEALDRFLEEFVDGYANPKQIHSRVNIVREHDISCLHLAAIRGKDLAQYIKEREKEGRSPQTVLHEVNLISRIFEICRRDWGMEYLENPAKKVNKPRPAKGRTRRLESAEEDKLLEMASPKIRPVIRFALETAMRRGEIASLTWRHVEIAKRYVHLPITKNGEARSVPLSPVALDILKTLPRDIKGGLVFQLKNDSITKGFARAVKKAGLSDLRFHDLRHEAISRLFENTDLDVMEIKSITGHKSLQMLARYSHLRTHLLADRLAGASRGVARHS